VAPASAEPSALHGSLAASPGRAASRLHPATGLVVLWLGAAAVSAITMLKGIQPNDEGLMLQAAARIAHGQVPYRDFWWFYPPGQPCLLGALWSLFGPSLLTWRIVRVLTDATVALLAYVLARRRASPPLALLAWLGAAGAMAFPSGPHPVPVALTFALGSLIVVERRPIAAGVLLGLCAAWRIEIAGYLAVGIVLALAISPDASALRAAAARRFLLAGGATGLILYAPVVALAGVGRSWDLLVRYPLLQFSRYQGLPLRLHYSGPLNTSSIGGFLHDSAENLVHFYVPVALIVGLVGSLFALVLSSARRERPVLVVATAVLGVGSLHYMLVRPDLFHTAPLAVLTSILAAWALAPALARRTAASALPAPAPARIAAAGAAVAAAAGLAWIIVEGIDRRVRTVDDRMVAIGLPVADGARDRAANVAPLEAAVRFVQRRVPAGQPIYVATLRSDLVTSGDPLFYVLAGRPNPTRYDIAAPGVVTSAPVQREIVSSLERAGDPLVVRFSSPLTALAEPNLAGRSSGVRILDRYLASHYRTSARAGPYVILERNR
jgi:hypothetical protein